LKAAATGQTPTILAASLTSSRAAITPAPAISAEAEISVPARRKKNGVSRANAMERSRSISTRSCRKTPATSSPAT
jgi:hypothetical protein